MPIFRVIKNKNYTVMSNYHLKDKELTLKAKGLLSQMLSLPDDWNYSIAGLVSINGEKETAITNALKELKEKGYLVVEKKLPKKGLREQIEHIYNVYEQPQNMVKQGVGFLGVDNQGVDNQGVDNQGVENQGQLNTNILNTNNKNNMSDDFEKIWELYPKKENKDTAFKHYKAWLKGKQYAGKTVKLTNKQMWFAVSRYADECVESKREKQYIKMGSTFFNEAIMEYVKDDS